MINLKTPEEIALMREAGRIAARVLQELEQALAVGVTTAHLDKLAEKLIRSLGGEPAFLGYQNFPASICTSINNEVKMLLYRLLCSIPFTILIKE